MKGIKLLLIALFLSWPVIGLAQVANRAAPRALQNGGDGTFSTLDVPGAVATVCNAIQFDYSVGVEFTGGRFTTEDGRQVGWTFDEFTGFQGIEVRAGFTSVLGVRFESIVGTFDDGDGSGCLVPGSGPCLTFLINELGLIELPIPIPPFPPGSRDRVIFSGNRGEGGAFTDGDGVVHGYMRAASLEILDPPGAVYSYATESSFPRTVGRMDTEDGVTHGYLRTRGMGEDESWETIDVPDSLATIAHGISHSGIIVGEFTDLENLTHGFLLERSGEFRTVDFPDAAATVVRAISNQRNDLCGSYLDADGNEHGFVFRPDPQ